MRLFGSSESVNHRSSRSSGASDRMTSFVIGRPAKFTPGAFGDLGEKPAIDIHSS